MTGDATRSMPRCAVIIPTFNGAALTRACLDALLENPPERCTSQVVIVDDASSDTTQATLDAYGDAITVVYHDENRGFATACNSGAKTAGDCDYLVFLNNDTLPTAGWLDALVDHALVTPAAAAVGAKLLFPNGTIQHAGVTIAQDRWPRHLYAGFPGEHRAVSRSRQVVAVTGACMLVRREDFDQLGGFDAAFHNGYEDVDLCLRLGQRGSEIWYCAGSVLYHLESVTRWPTGEPEHTGLNERLYEERWRGRIAPDDVQHYLADRLLSIEYGASYPVILSVSTDLAAVRRDGEELGGLERTLNTRSTQVMNLLATQTRSLLREQQDAHLPALTSGRKPARSAEVVAVGTEHRLGGGGKHRVSLLLPVKNQEKEVRELLPLVLEQSIEASLEIVAVDSGSHDDTVDALREFEATVIKIDPSDFDHGLTRNLAANHAHGDVLLFVSPRSRPVNDRWLQPLLATLDGDPRAAGVCSRVVPHRDADALTAKDGQRELSGSIERERKMIADWEAYLQMSVEERRVFLNFHTVSAALRAEAFTQIKFRSVATLGEDLQWAREAIEAGWALWHEPASTVYHSHQYTFRELFARNIDDGVANREINGRTFAEQDVLPLLRDLIADDWEHLHNALRLSGEELDRQQVDSVLRRVAQVTGQWIGVNHRELPADVVPFFSGVSRARRQRQ